MSTSVESKLNDACDEAAAMRACSDQSQALSVRAPPPAATLTTPPASLDTKSLLESEEEVYSNTYDEEATRGGKQAHASTARVCDTPPLLRQRHPLPLSDSVLSAMQKSWWSDGNEEERSAWSTLESLLESGEEKEVSASPGTNSNTYDEELTRGSKQAHASSARMSDTPSLRQWHPPSLTDSVLRTMQKSWWSDGNEEERSAWSTLDDSKADCSLTLPYGNEEHRDTSRLGGIALLESKQDERDEALHPPVASMPSTQQQRNEQKGLPSKFRASVDEVDGREQLSSSGLLPGQSEGVRRPGAEAVEGIGLDTSAACRAPSSTENMDASIAVANIVTDAEPVVYARSVSIDHTTRRRRIAAGVGILFLVVIVALSIGLTIFMSYPFSKQETEREKRCSGPDKEKDVFDHCFCYNNTDHFVWSSDEEQEYYKKVKAALQDHNVISDEIEESHQCSTQNKCLVWAANYNRLYMTKEEAYAALEQIESMAQFYTGCVFFLSMNGTEWKQKKGWLTDKYMCDWFGITCSFLGRVANIKLSSNGLAGRLPTELFRMAFLRELDLSRNINVTGTLPEEISQATALHMLDLSHTQLQGRIPSSLEQLEVLDRLILSNNSFTGALPENLTSRMRELHLGTNLFSGTLHPGLGELKALESFIVARNKLSGTIPTELMSWTYLEQIDLSHNHFTGSFPEFLGSFKRLVATFVVDTGLTGPIPESYCDDRHPHARVMANCTSNLPSCTCCDELVICVKDYAPLPIQGVV